MSYTPQTVSAAAGTARRRPASAAPRIEHVEVEEGTAQLTASSAHGGGKGGGWKNNTCPGFRRQQQKTAENKRPQQHSIPLSQLILISTPPPWDPSIYAPTTARTRRPKSASAAASSAFSSTATFADAHSCDIDRESTRRTDLPTSLSTTASKTVSQSMGSSLAKSRWSTSAVPATRNIQGIHHCN